MNKFSQELSFEAVLEVTKTFRNLVMASLSEQDRTSPVRITLSTEPNNPLHRKAGEELPTYMIVDLDRNEFANVHCEVGNKSIDLVLERHDPIVKEIAQVHRQMVEHVISARKTSIQTWTWDVEKIHRDGDRWVGDVVVWRESEFQGLCGTNFDDSPAPRLGEQVVARVFMEADKQCRIEKLSGER